ncbi:MAG: aminotransferase class I/II-fold pyridoxal phosphate-dependent enzyme [Candidatus Kapabacteria bacterium]|nr:aminotransferase class I/II-fold pyridoxal phosphate-dependent enzyme [Ignavibacteriota bacterium]MCW5885156.1 aminotransferase class I/II-fold pyridoxal phosphate-dependent enzyme [Candidatus Kapabacteria bacterium]
MDYKPANRIQDYLVFGEFGGVNPSITDSSTFTFLTSEKMNEIFEHEIEGCYLYSRHMNPMNSFLSDALALLENTPAAHVFASGMGAISCATLQLCSSGDEIVSSRTVYGGTFALFKNIFPEMGIKCNFVDITKLDEVKAAITPRTKVIYCETISNPMLEVADIKALRQIADESDCKLVVDNTFTPMVISPYNHGAHIVIHSLTKYINGASDAVGGVVCADREFISSMKDVNTGYSMLLGPTMDSLRAASILKNLRTLHIRMQQHSKNAMFIAEKLEAAGLRVIYPGLKSHPHHEKMKVLMNPGYGFSGMVTLDVKTDEIAAKILPMMQENLVGYFAVSLGFYKTLFSSPSHSTSSEIPEDVRDDIGMTGSIIRFSFGLDFEIERSWERIEHCLKEVGLL